MNKKELKKLPLGLSAFSELIQNNYVYIDKTRDIYQMITEGKYYFLSRPRRFGKSLLISTLDALFSSNKPLFKDLWIEKSDWNWTTHPVIKIDFSKIDYSSVARLEKSIVKCLYAIAMRYNVSLDESESVKDLFGELIDKLAKQNTVVLLIDEYDKPILDHIDNIVEAKAQRKTLKNLYSVIKSMDQQLHFVLLTGVSKFSQTSVFSGINNLEDITLDPPYATLLGYTNQELTHYFADHINNCAQKLDKTPEQIIDMLREYYDGYQFAENSPKVFNPYSVLTSLKKQAFGNYWFASGTPTFLITLIQHYNTDLATITNPSINKADLDSFEPDNIELAALLFQTGYLTIKSFDTKTNNYTLEIPNREVREGLTINLTRVFTQLSSTTSIQYARKLTHAFAHENMVEFQEVLQEFFNRMPYTVHVTDESKLQFVLYAIFALIGVTVDPEVTTSIGRADLVVNFHKLVYVIELKFNKSAQEALEQIQNKRYYEKYENADKKITLLGINFNSKDKTISLKSNAPDQREHRTV